MLQSRTSVLTLIALSLLSSASTVFAQVAAPSATQQVEALASSFGGINLNFRPLTPGMGVSTTGGTVHFALRVAGDGHFQGLVSVTSSIPSADAIDAMQKGMVDGKLPRIIAKKSDLHLYITDQGTIVAGETGANKILSDFAKKKPIKTKAPQSMYFPGNLISANLSGVVESVGMIRLPSGGSFMAMKGLAKLIADGAGNFLLLVMSRNEAIVIGNAGYAEIPSGDFQTLLTNLSLAGHFNVNGEMSKIFIDAD